MRGAALLLALCCGAAAESPAPDAPLSKTIAVRLRASWRATPLLLEASEFFGGEGLFWRFAEHPAVAGASGLGTEEAQHGAVVAAARELLAPLDQRLLETYLATSALSPRVEAQLAEERARAAALGVPAGAAWWAWACGRAHVPGGAETLEQFLAALDCAAERVDDDEAHVYGGAAAAEQPGARRPTVTLFASLGTPPFARAHEALRGAAEQGRIAYAHVHRSPPEAASAPSEGAPPGGKGGEEGAPLSGYGVSLAIKNMEYKVLDDAADSAQSGVAGIAIGAEALASLGEDAGGQQDEGGEVGGFDFGSLARRRPELAEQLGALRAQLEREAAADGARGAGGGDGSDLKVWALSELGFQAAFRVATAANPLGALRDISSNLPAVASALTKARVDPAFKRELLRNAETLWSAGQSLLTINGRPLPLTGADNDYFPALDLVRAELRLAKRIVALGVPPAAVPSLLAPPAGAGGGGGGGGAVCVSPLPAPGAPSPVVWLNNVEKDPQFRQLPRGLSELLEPRWDGQVSFVRRNVYSAILVADPTTADGAAAIQTALALLQQGAPLRFGLVVASGAGGGGAADGGGEALPPALGALLAAGWAEGAAAAELRAAGVRLPPSGAVGAPAGAAAGAVGEPGAPGGAVLRGAAAQSALYARGLALAARLGGPTGGATFALALHELRESEGSNDGLGGGLDPFMAMFGGGGGGGGFGVELAPVSRELVEQALAHALQRSKAARSAAQLAEAACAGLELGEDGGAMAAVGSGGGVRLLQDEGEEGGAGALSAADLEALLAQLPAAEAAAASDAVRNAAPSADEYVRSRSLGASLPLLLLNGKVHVLGEQAAGDESMGMLDRVLMMGALSAAESDARSLVRSGALADAPKAAGVGADGAVKGSDGAGAPAPDAESLLRTIAAESGCAARYDARIVGAEAARASYASLDDAALLARRSYLAPPAAVAASAPGGESAKEAGGAGAAPGEAERGAAEGRSCAAPALTHWVAADLGTTAGAALVASALERAEAAAEAAARAQLGSAGAPPACVRVSVVHRVAPDGAGGAALALTLALARAWEAVLAASEEEAAEGGAAREADAFGRTLGALRGVLLVGAAAASAAEAAGAPEAQPPSPPDLAAAVVAALRAHLGVGTRARALFDSAEHAARVDALVVADGGWCAAALDSGEARSAADAIGDYDDGGDDDGYDDDDEEDKESSGDGYGGGPGRGGARGGGGAGIDGYVLTNGRVLPATRAPGGGVDGGSLALLETAEWQAGGANVAAALARASAAAASAGARREAADRLLRVNAWLRQQDKAESVQRVRALDELAECGLACVRLEATRVGDAAAGLDGGGGGPSSGAGVGAGEGAGLAAALHVVALVDPLSRAAQRLAPVLAQLRACLGLRVTVFLNPPTSLSDLPLKEFYRYSAPHALAFDEAGRRAAGSARFAALSTPHTLTLHLDTGANWLTEPSACAQDMDNLRLSDVPIATPTVLAEYRLAALLISGSCTDMTTQSPPNGLQLVLSAPSANASASGGAAGAAAAGGAAPRQPPVLADTLVMQNLGYFQLQASPGVFALGLARGSLSAEIFDILALPPLLRAPSAGAPPRGAGRGRARARGARGLDGFAEEEALEPLGAGAEHRVAVRSFEGAVTRLLVGKKPGKEDKALLEGGDEGGAGAGGGGGGGGGGARGGRRRGARSVEEAEPRAAAEGAHGRGGGLWDAASSLWANAAAGAPAAGAAAESDPTIHVFSLASGQLYERFLKVMMLSVVEKSSRPVKFWLIRNFLSAAFRESAPQLAAAKGFKVEFVRYQWPPWLRAQSEKQRIIWGYKILFLDVLFPLGLTKVIYIDADQVVRADIAELWDHDLKGRAVGMTPFCSADANPHTTGFRFWAQGYWVEHLRGRPYHISALFVVDLARFRRRAAGDRYRVYYDNLSADPNSLSNLDQDLPNYAQHSVPIASLPEHWLWCETWCGNASKAEARTIDLCNNPLTKEPKIEMAKRIIGQRWIDLDNEARAIEASLAANATPAARGARGGAHDEL